MASDGNVKATKSFTGYEKIDSPRAIIDRINTRMASEDTHSQVYVQVWSIMDEVCLELLPDADSIEYSNVVKGFIFTSSTGVLLSTVPVDSAKIYYSIKHFEDGEIHEYFHLSYSTGVLVTFEILTLPN